MARNGDKGPYARWNVDIILFEQNMSDAFKSGAIPVGDQRSHTKLKRHEALEIFNAIGSYTKIAKKYGVYFGTVYDIKARRSWKHLTKGLPDPRIRTSSP